MKEPVMYIKDYITDVLRRVCLSDRTIETKTADAEMLDKIINWLKCGKITNCEAIGLILPIDRRYEEEAKR